MNAEPQVIVTEDGYRFERQDDGSYTDGDLSYGPMPKYLRELASMYDMDAFDRARRFFHDRGVSLAYVPRRGWRFYCIGRTDGPTYVVCWVSLEAMVEMLDAPFATLREIHAKGGNVRL